MIRRQRHPQGVRRGVPGSFAATLPQTEVGRQMIVCRSAARFKRLRGEAATKRAGYGEFRGTAKSQSSVLSPQSSVLSPQSSVLSPQSSERGFSLVSAIFLLVVIAALGTFAVTLSTTQQQSSAMDVQGARAYQAARAGIEWGAYQVLQVDSTACPATPMPLPAFPGTLSGFTVNVTCARTQYTEDTISRNIFEITSTAFQGTPATPGYVERRMSATFAP